MWIFSAPCPRRGSAEELCICKLPHLSGLKVKAKPGLAVGRGKSRIRADPKSKSSLEELGAGESESHRGVWVGRENLASDLSDVVPNPKQRERFFCQIKTHPWDATHAQANGNNVSVSQLSSG